MPTARQAKRAGPDLEAGPEASAEQREGTMEARMGRDAAGGSMRYAHDSATGHFFLAGDALTSRLDEHHAQDSPHARGIKELTLLLELRLVSGRSGAAGSAVFEGRQASRGGDSPQGFPWRQAKRAAPQARRREGSKPDGRDGEVGTGRSPKARRRCAPTRSHQ